MKYLLMITLAVMLTACSPTDNYQAPQAAAKAIQMCDSYGGVDKTETTKTPLCTLHGKRGL